MTAESIIEKLQRLGWGTTEPDLIRFYYAILLACKKKKKLSDKYPQIRFCDAYNMILDKGRFEGFQSEFIRFNAYGWEADLFDELAAEVAYLTLQEFAEMMLPDRISNSKFYDVLHKQYESPFFACLCLFFLLCISADKSIDEAYTDYVQLSSHQRDPLPIDAFHKLFCLMNWWEIRDKTSKKAAAEEINKLSTQMIITNERKCELVAEILQRQERLKDKDIVAPAAYLSKVKYSDKNVFQTVSATENVEKIIEQTSRSVSFLDFLAVLMHEGKGQNLTECGFLLPWVKQKWEYDTTACCLVNAVPSFLSAWKLTNQDRVTVPYHAAKQPVSEMLDAAVYSMDELMTIPYAEKQRVLYFSRGYSEKETRQHLLALCRDDALVYAVLPDIYKRVTTEIPGYFVTDVTILPTELYKNGRTKHFVAVLTPEENEVIKAEQVLLETIDRRFYCAPETLWTATMVSSKDYATRQPLRSLFSQSLKKKENVKERNRPREFVFSPELRLWYTATPNQAGNQLVCLYLCEVPTEQQKKRNKYPRGKKIVTTETWNTNIPEEKIGSWIAEHGAYNEKLRSKAIQQIKLYKGKTLSLKSLWYCLCDRVSFSDEEASRITKLLKNKAISELSIGAVSEGDIENALSQVEEKTEETISLLDTLFDMAVKRKYITEHPFEALREARKKQKRREESIRALAKRSYTEAEEIKIWELFENNREDSGSLGMIICFLTGLTPPYVAALTWRDWRKITHTNHTQLVANKKLLPDGTLEWQMEEDDCRLLPLMDILSDVLREHKQKTNPLPDDRIVAVEGNPLQVIRKRIQEAEEYAEIAPDLISVPGADKQMDLNQYAGSRMRENFERHCYVNCGMTDAEVHYLIMRQMPDTLSRKYVDYGHECIQERMSVKLNQWGQRFKTSGGKDWRLIKLSKQKTVLSSEDNYTKSCHITAQITNKLAIVAECNHDFEYRFLIRGEA